MTYRKFDTGTWQDPWFEGLTPNAKLAFIYFWTNEICNQAGLYQISKKRIEFELGYGIDTIYSEIDNKVIWYNDQKIVWIKNFFKRQCQNNKFAISALNAIKDDPFKLQLFITYNRKFLEVKKVNLNPYLDMVSIPYPTETEQNSTETEQNSKDKKTSEQSSEAFQNKQVKNSDFSINFSEVFAKINNKCIEIINLPPGRNQKYFNPKEFAQKMINQAKHPEAIYKALDGIKIYWEQSPNPWAAGIKIINRENGNSNEQEAIQIHKKLKQLESPELLELSSGLFQEV